MRNAPATHVAAVGRASGRPRHHATRQDGAPPRACLLVLQTSQGSLYFCLLSKHFAWGEIVPNPFGGQHLLLAVLSTLVGIVEIVNHTYTVCAIVAVGVLRARSWMSINHLRYRNGFNWPAHEALDVLTYRGRADVA